MQTKQKRQNSTYGDRGAIPLRLYAAIHAMQHRGSHVCMLEHRAAYVACAHLLAEDGLPLPGKSREYAGLIRKQKRLLDESQNPTLNVEKMLCAQMIGDLRKNRRSGKVVYRQINSEAERHAAFERRFGYSLHALREHLESQFTPAMTWELVEKQQVQIDHKYPARMFDLTTADGVKRAYALSNLQPLWRRDNIVKGRTFDAEVIALFGVGAC